MTAAVDQQIRVREIRIAKVFADIKVGFAVFNFFVVYLIGLYPGVGRVHREEVGFAAAGVFLCWTVLARYWIKSSQGAEVVVRWLTPLGDVLATIFLISITGGPDSPFFSLISLATIGSAFMANRRIPVVTALASLAAYIVVIVVPHPLPINLPLFFVRIGTILSFGVVGSILGSRLHRQTSTSALIDQYTLELSAITSEVEAAMTFVRFVRLVLRAEVAQLALDGLPATKAVAIQRPLRRVTFQVRSGGRSLGVCHLLRERPFDDEERQSADTLTERLGSTIIRIRLARELVDETARQARIGGIAASGRHQQAVLESLAKRLQASMKQVSPEAPIAVELSRAIVEIEAALELLRRDFRSTEDSVADGLAYLRDILEEQRNEDVELQIDPSLNVPSEYWRVFGLMLREGINNAHSHGNASHITFQLRKRGNGLVALLAADGESPEAQRPFGFGLSRLAATVEANGGSMTLSAGDNGGSVLGVRFRLPSADWSEMLG